MADNTNRQPNIEQVRDLLSPYLDGEVTDAERVLVEETIATSPELRAELETLRQTVALVSALPSVPAPRPFTLSEADVQAVSPTPKRQFGLPAWAGGLVMLATVLLCVAAGGFFFWGQLGGGSPVGELAQFAAEQPAEAPAADKAEQIEVEKEVEPGIAQEEAAAEAPAPEKPLAEEAPPAEAAPAEKSEAEEPAAEPEMAVVEAEPTGEGGMGAGAESSAAQPADDTLPRSGEAESPNEVDADSTVGMADAVPTPSPPAIPTMSPTPAAALAAQATEITTEKASPGTEDAAEQPPVAEAAPPSAPATQSEPDSEHKEVTPRQVEIENQQLSITPGLIQIEGMIEAAPGSILQAAIQRNNEAFDTWAAPASLQTVVQTNGQFSFNIQASADQRNRDLFALEPANYQITIITVRTDSPVIASIFFDTFGPVTATTEPTIPPSPSPTLLPEPTSPPSPTAVARLTIIPSATPAIKATEPGPASVQTPSPKVPIRTVGIGIVALVGALLVIGLIAWAIIIRNSKHKP